MKLAEWKFRFLCADDLTDEQVIELLNKLEVIEERITQYIQDNKPEGTELQHMIE